MIYTVQSGDTLAATTFRLFGHSRTWQEWAEYANIAPHHLEVGQRIRYPDRWPRRPRYPLDTRTAYYEYGDLYASGTWFDKPHPGVDFYERSGAWVYAAGEGIVRVSKYDEGYGHYMMIEHLTTKGPKFSLYGHLSIPGFYPVGAELRGTDIHIGFEGMSGNAGGWSHVHCEIKRTDELGLFPLLHEGNLNHLYHSPREWLSDPETLIVPVSCWGCPGRGCL